MANVIVVGAQWGDEGKGKVVDLYSEFADIVVRFGGGANAGHTLVVGTDKIVTHLIPSGVLRGRGKKCVLGDGMVIDPKTLLEEIATLKQKGVLQDDADLLVSAVAHVILPLHRELDRVHELGKGAIGTTKRGIGPAYEAKMARRGVRMGDLLRPARLKEMLVWNREETADYLRAHDGTLPALEVELAEYLDYGARLKHYFADTSRYIHDEMKKGKHVLFEGAQGALLDVDRGTYPFVTSSSTIAGGAMTGAGVGPTTIDSVIGITKAYATRVGSGPFPTELAGAAGDRLREAGGEYGATTGRPRRCGWLDVAALRLAVRWNGLAGVALTKLDVLTGFGPLQLCVGYTLDGKTHDELPCDPEDILRATPIFEELPGWQEPLTAVRKMADLPAAALAYVHRLEALIGVPVTLLSIGPARDETILLQNPFAQPHSARSV